MIVKLIQVHANNIVFTLKIRLYFPKFLTIRIFPCYFFISIRPFFFYFLCFPVYNNVFPKYYQSYKKISVNNIRNVIFANYYKRIGFSKENSY